MFEDGLTLGRNACINNVSIMVVSKWQQNVLITGMVIKRKSEDFVDFVGRHSSFQIHY